MFSVQAVSRASPDAIWPLLAEPRRWSSWAPHVRGAAGLGVPEVALGRRGVVLLAYVMPVPVKVTAKRPGESWEWACGPMRFRHRVVPHPAGSLISLELEAPAALEPGLAAVYGRLMQLVVRRLADCATDA